MLRSDDDALAVRAVGVELLLVYKDLGLLGGAVLGRDGGSDDEESVHCKRAACASSGAGVRVQLSGAWNGWAVELVGSLPMPERRPTLLCLLVRHPNCVCHGCREANVPGEGADRHDRMTTYTIAWGPRTLHGALPEAQARLAQMPRRALRSNRDIAAGVCDNSTQHVDDSNCPPHWGPSA